MARQESKQRQVKLSPLVEDDPKDPFNSYIIFNSYNTEV